MKIKWIFVGLLTGWIFIAGARSQHFYETIRNQELIGARPMAMGEAFVAVADDMNAIRWNPAGMPTLNQLGANSMHTNLFQNQIGMNYLALYLPGFAKTSIGFDWINISNADDELEFSNNQFNFSGGYPFTDWLAFGFSAKYIRMSAAMNKSTQGAFSGWGADCGVLCQLHPKLRLGLMIHDFTNTSIDGLREPIYPRSFRLGLAYQLFNQLLLAADFDDRLHIGSEWWTFDRRLALRAGLQEDFYTDEPITLSCGIGVNIPVMGQRICFDYAFTDMPTLPSTNRFSLSFLIDLFPNLIRIKKLEIDPVYASLYKYHSKSPIGRVYVEHKGKKDLDCTLSVRIAKYASAHERNIILPAKTTQDVPIKTVFCDSIMDELDNIPLGADVSIRYMSGNKRKEARESGEFPLFSRNSIDWRLGAEQAAAFITPNDPVIDLFARRVLAVGQTDTTSRMASESIARAVCLFNALSLYGIRYEEDSFRPNSKRYQALDHIQYPAQLLKKKTGDCDDLCVLMSSVFENRNVATALVNIPYHIFLLFDTGIHPRRAFELCCPDDRYVIHQNRLWIPLEVTWIERSFCDAWIKGAETIRQQSEDNVQIIPVRDAWETYEPVAYAGKFFNPFWDFPQNDLKQEKARLERDRKAFLLEMEKRVARYPDSTRLRNKLALAYMSRNQLKQAKHHFEQILRSDPTNAGVLNNIGNLYFMEGNLDSAQLYYLNAINQASLAHGEGVHLNLGLLYAAADMESLAVENFAAVIRDSSDFYKLSDLLGIPIGKDGVQKGDQFTAKKKISRHTVQHIANKSAKKQKKRKPKRAPKKKKTRKKKQVPLGAKGDQPKDEIENIFYWAQ